MLIGESLESLIQNNVDKNKNNHFMRAFYYLFYTFLITCFQYTSTNVGKNLGA